MTDTSSANFPFGLPEAAVPLRDGFDRTQVVHLTAPRSFEVGIPMRDGVELAATVHVPAKSGLPAAAIVHGTPYDKDMTPEADIRRKVDAGYVHVRYDSRGRGKSEGIWHPFVTDGPDGHDVVEWVARQDWCDGAVGIEGLSYDAWIVMATMSQQPAHLRAAIPVSPCGRWQQEIPYTFGSFQLYFAWWWAMVRRRIMDSSLDVPKLLEMLPVGAMGEVLNSAGPGWQEWMEHDTLDELWQGRRWDGAYDFGVPTLHVTGWHDREDIQAAFHHYEQMMDHSPVRDDQWLLVGPWSHVSSYYPSDVYKGVHAPGAALDMAAIHLRFFDRFLRGEPNGVDDEPRVRMYDPGAKSWQVRPAWRGGTRSHDLFLGENGTLLDQSDTDGASTYRYDPMKPNGMSYATDVLPWEPPLDLADFEKQDGVISWTGATLTEDLTVRGWGEFEMWAATDGNDTEWHVKLADVDESGRALWVGWGCLRASYAVSQRNPQPVEPGAQLRYSVELTPTFHTFLAGHRVRVLLSSSEFPWFARNLNQFGPIASQSEPRIAINTVFHGTTSPSRLRLQVEE